jgi:hypothetical protein
MDGGAVKHTSVIFLATQNRTATPQHFYSNNDYVYNIKDTLVAFLPTLTMAKVLPGNNTQQRADQLKLLT